MLSVILSPSKHGGWRLYVDTGAGCYATLHYSRADAIAFAFDEYVAPTWEPSH